MQFQNDDMDDLLRRAAEHYPLDTSGADWNKVLNALQEDETKAAVVVPERKSRGRLLWLLLLLPLGLVCNHYYGEGWFADKKTGTAEKVNLKKTSREGQPNNIDNGNRDQITNETNKQYSPSDNMELDESGENGSRNHTKENLPSTRNSSSVGEFDIDPGTSNSTPGQRNKQKENFKQLANKKPANKNISGSAHKQQRSILPAGKNDDTEVVLHEDKKPAIENDSSATRQWAENLRNEFPLKGSSGLPASSSISNQFQSEFVAKKTPETDPPKRFYAGIMGGVDMTTVKFQKVENYGHDYGILLGYRIHSKWSVETGLYRASRDYYSDGKYYNSKKIYLPPNTKITEVSGNCLMWEIPVNVKYDFSKIKKHSWFAIAGMSSYLMKKEDYSYLYYYGGSGTSAWHDRSYKNASRNLFSVVNLSVGYSRSLGKVGDIRIEPYFKLPVSKMGVGEMPLMSAGLHVGFTKILF